MFVLGVRGRRDKSLNSYPSPRLGVWEPFWKYPSLPRGRLFGLSTGREVLLQESWCLFFPRNSLFSWPNWLGSNHTLASNDSLCRLFCPRPCTLVFYIMLVVNHLHPQSTVLGSCGFLPHVDPAGLREAVPCTTFLKPLP